MTTARDLLTITLDLPSARSVERGVLSLGLAAAELVDLLKLDAAVLDGDRIVPRSAGGGAAIGDGAGGAGGDGGAGWAGDRMLGEAAAALAAGPRGEPETVEDWLWRRGRDLTGAYLDAFEAEGRLTRERRRRWGLLTPGRVVLADSPERRRAAHRWSADEPLLVALACAVGTGVLQPEPPDALGSQVVAVLDALHQAVAELAEERARRARRKDEARITSLRRGY
jgi:hypothetical protein